MHNYSIFFLNDDFTFRSWYKGDQKGEDTADALRRAAEDSKQGVFSSFREAAEAQVLALVVPSNSSSRPQVDVWSAIGNPENSPNDAFPAIFRLGVLPSPTFTFTEVNAEAPWT